MINLINLIELTDLMKLKDNMFQEDRGKRINFQINHLEDIKNYKNNILLQIQLTKHLYLPNIHKILILLIATPTNLEKILSNMLSFQHIQTIYTHNKNIFKTILQLQRDRNHNIHQSNTQQSTLKKMQQVCHKVENKC